MERRPGIKRWFWTTNWTTWSKNHRRRRPTRAAQIHKYSRFAAPTSDGETRTRTGDTTIFSRVLYQLSYLAAGGLGSASDASDSVGLRRPWRPAIHCLAILSRGPSASGGGLCRSASFWRSGHPFLAVPAPVTVPTPADTAAGRSSGLSGSASLRPISRSAGAALSRRLSARPCTAAARRRRPVRR